VVVAMVNYVDKDYDDTTIFDPLGQNYEVVSTWDAVGLKAVAKYTFSPVNVELWDETYSWLMMEIKVSDLSKLTGVGYVVLSSSLISGEEELVFPISSLTVLSEYDKFMMMIDQFTGSTFDATNLQRVEVWVEATSQITLKWRKARVIHLTAPVDVTPWVSSPYVTVVVDHSKVPTALQNVPVRIVIDEQHAAFAMMLKDHQSSIFVVDGSGNNVHFSIEAWDTYTCVLWALLPEVSDVVDTTILVYYDPTGTLINAKTILPSMWNVGYPLVLSMDKQGTAVVDETPSGILIDVVGTDLVREDGLRRLVFNGTSDYMTIPIKYAYDFIMATKGHVTFEVIPSSVVQSDYACLMSKAVLDEKDYQAYSFMWSGSTIRAEFSNHTDGTTILSCDAPTSLGKAVITIQWQDQVCQIWINGVKAVEGSIPILDDMAEMATHLFGKTYNDVYGVDEYFEGDVYAVVVANGMIDGDRIIVDHANRLGQLVTVGNVPMVETLFENVTPVAILASPTSAVDHYQVVFTIHSTEGISRDDDLYLGMDCRTDCRDIVLVDTAGVPMYCTVLGTDNTTYATYAIRIVDIPDHGVVMFNLCHGWIGCPDNSDPVMVYEDYEGSVLNVDMVGPPIIVWYGELLPRFMYSKEVTVLASPDGEFDHYQLEVVVHRDEGVDSESDVYVSTHCRGDYRDVVFVDGNDELLSHYIESWDAESATFIVRFPGLPSSGSVTFGMYYKSNTIRNISDLKGTEAGGVITTTNPPSIDTWGTEVFRDDLSLYQWYKTFTISDIPQDGWFGIQARINRVIGIDSFHNVYLRNKCDPFARDLICTTLNDSKVLDYNVVHVGLNFIVVQFLMKLLTTSPREYKLRYGRDSVDNQTDWRPVILSVLS
jgi:hypothetical protein